MPMRINVGLSKKIGKGCRECSRVAFAGDPGSPSSIGQRSPNSALRMRVAWQLVQQAWACVSAQETRVRYGMPVSAPHRVISRTTTST